MEKLWACRYCGYPKNTASSSLCQQCGTNQLGEQQILPSATTRGVAVEAWTVRSRVEARSAAGAGGDGGPNYSEGRRFVTWSREDWPFRLKGGHRASELPTALALAEHGFVVEVSKPTGAKKLPGLDRWGTKRFPSAPTPIEASGKHLEWIWASAGAPVPEKVSQELVSDLGNMRQSFFPEKVSWFYEQIHRLQVEAMMEEVPVEFATAYPNSVLRDSLGMLNKVTPMQVLMGKYKIQFVAARSHTRGGVADLTEKWLGALFGQLCDPGCGILAPVDDGSLELNGTLAGAHDDDDDGAPDAAALSFFHALGRAIAMALVSRTFVDAPLSPALCKLLLGRPLHFLDLLSSSQALFRDLLKLMMLPSDAVSALRLAMPSTTSSPAKDSGTRSHALDEHCGGRKRSFRAPSSKRAARVKCTQRIKAHPKIYLHASNVRSGLLLFLQTRARANRGRGVVRFRGARLR